MLWNREHLCKMARLCFQIYLFIQFRFIINVFRKLAGMADQWAFEGRAGWGEGSHPEPRAGRSDFFPFSFHISSHCSFIHISCSFSIFVFHIFSHVPAGQISSDSFSYISSDNYFIFPVFVWFCISHSQPCRCRFDLICMLLMSYVVMCWYVCLLSLVYVGCWFMLM